MIDGKNEGVLIEACGKLGLSRVQMMRFDNQEKYKRSNVTN